jgi:O-antigen/teichoic acid export membrane protein
MMMRTRALAVPSTRSVSTRARTESASSTRAAVGSGTLGWRRNTEILGNAGTLIATAGVSALLGFAFWTIAAHLFSQAAIGYAAATTSAMTLLGTIGMFGLGTFLIAELPGRAARTNLIAAAMLTAGIGSAILGGTFVLVAPHLSASLRNSSGTLTGALIVVAGVVLTAATFVFDQAAIALLRGGLQLSRNVIMAAAKLLVLPAAAYFVHDQFGNDIALSWVTGTVISVVAVALWLRRKGTSLISEPDWAALRGMRGTLVAYNWLGLAFATPTLLTPILVTVLVSPAANGAFYAAWVMVSMLFLVPTNLSTVLFAVASSEPRALAAKLRFTLAVSLLVGIPGMAVLGLGARSVLSVFGPSYVHEAALPLSLLVIAYVPTIPRTHYIAVSRATGKIPRAASVMTVAALMELAAVVIGAKWGGLVGLSVALLGVKYLTGAAVTPAIVRAALARGRHRRVRLARNAGEAVLTPHAARRTTASQQEARVADGDVSAAEWAMVDQGGSGSWLR